MYVTRIHIQEANLVPIVCLGDDARIEVEIRWLLDAEHMLDILLLAPNIVLLLHIEHSLQGGLEFGGVGDQVHGEDRWQRRWWQVGQVVQHVGWDGGL